MPESTEVKTTTSGLKYCVLKAGTGDQHPAAVDTVKVHYSGWLENGTLFDSSVKRGEPISFPLNGVIKGWTEGVQLMTPGSRYKLIIPGDLAYGANPPPGSGIPVDATLVFEIELLEIVTAPKYQALNAEKAKKLESGIRYEILAEGAGNLATAADGVEVKFGCWNTKGEPVVSWVSNGPQPAPLKGLCSKIPLDFLKEVVPLLKSGGKLICEVPAALCFKSRAMNNLPADSTSVWMIELVKINSLPVAFSKPDLEKMKTTGTGLAYEHIKEGAGASIRSSDQLKVHYIGWLEDGTVFDSSYLRGEAMPMRGTGGVIKGWQEGLGLMKEGGIARFVIPAALAYGATPKAGIPANSTLIFYVEVLKVN